MACEVIHATDDAFGRDGLRQLPARIERFQRAAIEFTALFLEVPPRKAVDGRHHDRAFMHQRFDLRQRALQLMRLGAENKDILRACFLHVVGRMGRAVPAVAFGDEGDALLAQALQRRAAGDVGDRIARTLHQAADQAAHGARAQYRNFRMG